jgi:hypothetical protein
LACGGAAIKVASTMLPSPIISPLPGQVFCGAAEELTRDALCLEQMTKPEQRPAPMPAKPRIASSMPLNQHPKPTRHQTVAPPPGYAKKLLRQRVPSYIS